MQYLRRNAKYSILAFLIIVLSITISISTLAKTEAYFSLYDNPFLLTGSYNWTFSANHRNDENLMVIDDPEIIARYQNQFEKLWFDKFSLERTRQLYQIAKVDFLSMSTTSPKPVVQTININTVSKDEFIKILKTSEPLARKIIALRGELGGFKDPQDLTQLPEITNIEWEEWEEEGIRIIVN